MCATCGCGDDAPTRLTLLSADPGRAAGAALREGPPHDHHHEHHHEHGHGHEHGHEHDATPSLRRLEIDVLAKNNGLAERNRRRLAASDCLAINLMSSPGSGKTTLLVRTLTDLRARRPDAPLAVIEGDQETALDAQRIAATGVDVVQVNTGANCHLDAEMIDEALDRLQPAAGTTLLVENVGNLVCPAAFDLGEAAKVAVISVTEGADKPAKYPHMFAAVDLVVVNKIDLLPYVDFDVEACLAHVRDVNPQAASLCLSATTGEGLEAWYDWLEQRRVAFS